MNTIQNGKSNGSKNTTVLMSDRREEAKQALCDLRSYGFDFDQIVANGLNPEILRGLYKDLGFQFTQGTNDGKPFPTEPNMVKGDALTTSTAKEAPQVIVSQQTLPGLPSTEVCDITNKSTIRKGKEEKTLLSGSTSSSKVSKPTNANFSGKSSSFKATDSKGVNRKEYIARLAAAKASVSSKAAMIQTKSPVRVTASRSPSSTANQPHVEPASTTAPESELEAKRKAQTDLARQKIEALKLRGSTQQVIPAPKDPNIGDQNQPPPVRPQQEPTSSGPATIPRSTPPNRQGSYFSPTTQKPPFSIPGLFMTSEVSQTMPTQQFSSQILAMGQQSGTRNLVDIETRNSSLSQSSDPQSKPSMATQASSIPSSIATTSPTTIPVINTTPPPTSRKRQKAADFIDPPSTRIKRPLGQQEDNKVIIDISEDDASGEDDAGNSEMEIDDHPLGPLKKPNSAESVVGKRKSIRDLPPLTDLPPRKKRLVMTPPAAQTPGQTKDPKQLKSKEIEIELMRRKIAELEQRNHAKRNTSRAQTPGTSGSAPVSSPLPEPLEGLKDPPNTDVGAIDTNSLTGGIATSQRSASAPAETTESASKERLVAEQRLQEAKLARAEAEHSLAVDDALASEQDQRLREESLQALNLEGEVKQLPGQKHDQFVDRGRLRSSEQEGSQEPTQEARQLEDPEAGNQAELLKHAGHERLEVQELKYKHQQAEQNKLHDEQQRARKVEIEAGLPILDASVERTKQRIESLKREMMELEEEVQRGFQGRTSLIEELVHLSGAVKPIQSAI